MGMDSVHLVVRETKLLFSFLKQHELYISYASADKKQTNDNDQEQGQRYHEQIRLAANRMVPRADE